MEVPNHCRSNRSPSESTSLLIDSRSLAQYLCSKSGTSGIEDIFVDPVTSKVYFAQNRPDEGGRSVLVAVETGKDVIPDDFDARTKVHEYGGAAAVVRNDVLYFSNIGDGRVYLVNVKEGASMPEVVTPGESSRSNECYMGIIADGKVIESEFQRFASFSIYPQHTHLILATCEDHVDEGWHPWRVQTYIVLIDASTSTVTRIWTGSETLKGLGEKKSGVGEGTEGAQGGEGMGENDFFAYAQWSEDGKRIVWQQW